MLFKFALMLADNADKAYDWSRYAFLRQILNPTLKVSVLSAFVKLYRRATRSDSQILAGFS